MIASLIAAGCVAAGLVALALALAPAPRSSATATAVARNRRFVGLGTQLQEAGIRIAPHTFVLLNAVAVALGGLIGGLVAMPAAMLGAVAGTIAPILVLRATVGNARARADREALVLLRHLSAHLRAGATYIEALRAAAEGVATAQVQDDLAWITSRFRLDRPLHASLAVVAARTPGRNLRLAYRVLARAIEHGVAGRRAVTALDGLEGTIAANLRAKDDLRAKTRGLRIQIFVVALAVPIIHVYLRWTNPASFTVMDQPLGQYVLLPSAVLCELGGLLLWHRFTRGRP
ncbi:MAG: type II secretion system F family protein [Chloroflexi bacterium]|nr:type II secretion system F family protein [Chloroflexota bacterium]